MKSIGSVRGLRTRPDLLVVLLLSVAMAGGCSGGKDEADGTATATAKSARAKKQQSATDPQTAGGAAAQSGTAKESPMAPAVSTGKTAAAVDLKYDLPTKPAVGQPFEITLAFEPRLAADTLDVEITEASGLTVAGESISRFAPVEAGQSYRSRIVVQGNAPGMYYLSLIAKMGTKVQSEARTFSIPIVIGDPPVAQKPTPKVDASGQPVQPMPAKES
jgi:hypothetical protein